MSRENLFQHSGARRLPEDNHVGSSDNCQIRTEQTLGRNSLRRWPAAARDKVRDCARVIASCLRGGHIISCSAPYGLHLLSPFPFTPPARSRFIYLLSFECGGSAADDPKLHPSPLIPRSSL